MTTTPIDSGIEAFYATVELQAEPQLTSGTFTGDLLKLKQIKDQDVKLVDGQITVVEEVVTKIEPVFANGSDLYAFSNLKRELQQVADEAKKNGATVKGHIIIQVIDSTRDKYPEWLRLVVVNDKVVVQQARLGWEDGTQTPFPTET